MFINFFFRKSHHLWDMSKNMVEPEKLDNKAYTRSSTHLRPCIHTPTHSHAHARMNLPTRTNTHVEICNNYRFYTATVVSWTHLSVTLYVRCMSCWFYDETFCRDSLHFCCSLQVHFHQFQYLQHRLQSIAARHACRQHSLESSQPFVNYLLSHTVAIITSCLFSLNFSTLWIPLYYLTRPATFSLAHRFPYLLQVCSHYLIAKFDSDNHFVLLVCRPVETRSAVFNIFCNEARYVAQVFLWMILRWFQLPLLLLISHLFLRSICTVFLLQGFYIL